MFKIAFCAGHYIDTPGKRMPKSLDPNETREWVLNNRVAGFFAEAAERFENVLLMRTDDSTGEGFIDIPQRAAVANAWGADLYLDLHHNAAGKVFSGGGVEAFSYPGSAEGKKYRDAIYAAVINAGGLVGNRLQPLKEYPYDSLSMTNMAAVLIEYGYMDSTVDAPMILTDEYSRKVAYATMEGIAKVAGLKRKKVSAPEKKPESGYTLVEFIKDVQRACGAKVDGISGQETLSKTVTLSDSKNRTHAVVKAVQQRLYTIGYTQVGAADGIAGTKFTAAVTAFQEDNHCWIDGEITARNKTWRKLLGME